MSINKEKPSCKLIGKDGNVFNLIGLASQTLKKHKMFDEAKEMANRCFQAGSYCEALCIIGEYVRIK
jgi:hypothetical protein